MRKGEMKKARWVISEGEKRRRKGKGRRGEKRREF